MSRITRSGFVISSISAMLSVALVVACSASGGFDGVLEDDAAVAPVPTTPLPPPSDSGNTVPDAKIDARTDAPKDTGIDAAKPPPKPGDVCNTADEIFVRACGFCGTQSAICGAKPDGTPGLIVSEYSVPCGGEKVDGCEPNAVQTEPCGNCGTRKRTCSATCSWLVGACTGEPANSCSPGTDDLTSAGCPAGVVRTRTCVDACTWTSFSPACDAGFRLVVGAATGDTVSRSYPLKAAFAAKRMTGTCPNGFFSSTTNHPYVYVELVNPTASPLTLSAWNTAVPNGPVINTLMAWYEGNVPPDSADEAARKACTKGVNDVCPAGLPCGSTLWAGLTGTNAITLPPSGSAILFFGSYFPAGGASLSEGVVKLVVRTD